MRLSIIIFLIEGLTVFIYSNSLGNDFVWDDDNFVVRNDIIKSLRNIPLFFTLKEAVAKGTLSDQVYRPFLSLSFGLDYRLWGLNPLGYHSINLILHIFNALLVFWFVLIISGNRHVALLSSLVFASHPIQTEAVSWISGRADVLFLLFYLLALIFYVKYIRDRKILLYMASLAFFICSVMSKEMAVSLPFLIILFDMYFGKRERPSSRAIRYFAYFLILQLYLFVRFSALGAMGQGGYWAGDFYSTMLSMTKGIVYYIRLLLLPMRLCADYMTFPVSRSLTEISVLLSIFLLMSIIAIGVFLKRYSRALSFSILWFFVTLLPVTNVIPMRILIAERFLYLPSIGYAIFLAIILVGAHDYLKKFGRTRIIIFAISLLLIFFYSTKTMDRNREWADDVAFNEANLKWDPLNPRAQYGLGIEYYKKGDSDKAYRQFKKVVILEPRFILVHEMMAYCYLRMGDIENSIKHLREMLRIDPACSRVYVRLAFVYAHMRDYDRAFIELNKALALNEGSIDARFVMGRLYELTGEYGKAIREYERIVSRKDIYHAKALCAAVYLRIGELYAIMGNDDKAVVMWQVILRQYPEQTHLVDISRFLLGEVEPADFEKMVYDWHQDIKAVGLYYMGWKREIEADYDGAVEFYKRCIETFGRESEEIRLMATERLENIEKRLDVRKKER